MAIGLCRRRLHVLSALDRCRLGGHLCPRAVADWAGAGVINIIGEAADALGMFAFYQLLVSLSSVIY